MMTIEERAFKAYPIDEEFRKGFEELKENGVHNICVDDSFSKERYAYIKACKEYESLPKIHGWVARDKSGDLDLYGDIPSRVNGQFIADSGSGRMFLDNDLFPDLTWADEPREVELLIRKV